MGNGTTTWEDVLSGPNESVAEAPATPNAPSKPPKRGKGIGWDDVLAQASTPSPVTLNAHRGGFSGDMPPASPESSGLSPLLSRIFPQLLKPSERTGSHYEAAPNQPTPDERLGEMVPESAVPALSFANRYAVQPFEKVAQAGAKAGGEILEGTAARVLQPIAAPELAAQPTTSMEEMEKRFPTTLAASKGIGKVAGGAVVDPRNWPFFGSGAARPILQRLISVGFTGLMGKGAVDAAQQLHDNWDKLTPFQRAEIGTESGLSAALAALTATHALGSEASVSETAPRPEGYQPSRQGETGEQGANIPSQPQQQPTAGMPSGRDTSWEDVLRRPSQAAPQETPRTQPEQALTPTATQMPQEATQTGPEPAGQPLKGWDEVLQQPQPAEVTQAPRASVSTARQPVALRSQQETPGEYGGEAVVKTPTTDLPAKYKLVEAQDLTPSHNAETFAPNPSYPLGVQERTYHTSKEAQARVIQQAQNYDPRFTINTNPDAVNGPPIVTPDGTVLGGNSRTMSTQRLYERGQGDTYREYLRKNASQFGISPDAVDKMEKPVLVREIPAPSDVEAARRLGSELNKNMTGALGTSERAVSAGRSITPQSLSAISGMLEDLGAESSIRDLLRERGRDVLSLLTKDGAITDRERPQFVDTSTGGLSEEGKQFAERALLGTVVEDPTLMDRAPKSIINKLDGSLADISSIAPRTDEYNLLPLIREAIAEHADIAARGLDVATHLAQTGMFGPERNPAVDAIVRKLGEKPKAVREAFRSFARDANAGKQGQGFLDLVAQPNAREAFNEAFGAKLTDTEFQQSVLQSLERETQKGKAYEQTTQQENFPLDESLREQFTEGTSRRTATGTESHQPGIGRQQREQHPPSAPSETGDSLDLFRAGPGAKTASAGNETGVSHLEQLRESLAHVTSPKLSITQRIAKALKQSVDFSKERDSATKAWDRAKSVSVALWDAYRRPAPWTDFKDAVGKYSGALQRSNHELRLFSDEVQRTVPDKLRREALTNYIQADGDLRLLRERASQSTGTLRRGYETALRLNESERTLANNVRNYFNAQLDEATKAGILENGVEDYVNQLWERNPNNPVARQVRAEIAYSRLQPNPTFAKHRVFESYFEGEQAGFNPKDKDIGFLLSTYQQSFSKAIGARALIRSLLDATASDGRPLVAITGRSNPIESTRGNTVHIIRPRIKPSEAFDYQTVNHPALRRWKWVGTDEVSGNTLLQEGDLAVHPEAYQHLKNILSTSALRQYAVGRAALRVSSTLKQTLLSMSPFHQVQEAVHATLHGVNPVRIMAPRALNLGDPLQSQLIDHGLIVADFDGMSVFQEGVAAGGLISKVPVVGQIEAKYRDYLFKDYIPRLKMEMATEAAKRNLQRYKGQLESGKITRDQIFELTANQANAAFGELNYKMLGRNPTVQDLLRLSVLAPDFLEARLRFTGQALKPYGREQATALLLRGAVGMYVSARIINQLLDDDPHWDRPFSVVIKGREYALRSVPGDIYHLISDPRSFVYHRLNPTFTRPAVEALFGRDQLGRPRSAWEQVKDFVAGVAPIPVQG